MEENMVRRITLGILLILAVAVAACGGGEADTTTGVSDAATSAQLPAGIALPLSMQLSIGTLMLEGTSAAVTPAQAQELLPLWQMLKALQESGTASDAETEAVLAQIEDGMTPDQLAVIEDMNQEDMQALMQELGSARQGDAESGGFSPPEGMMPPGGQDAPGIGADRVTDLSPEELAALMEERMGSGLGATQTEEVIRLLESRSAEV
jgi:hypothetical protein